VAVLFTVNIETEPYKSNVYHGLTVRCAYSNEPKDSSYEVGVAPYNEVEKVTMSRASGRPISMHGIIFYSVEIVNQYSDII
jgi:hypothetical protein